MFEVGRVEFIFEFDIFVFETVAIGVAIGVGVEMVAFRLTLLLLTVLFAAPPQAAPKVPIANTAVSAIFFIYLMISCLLQRLNLTI